MIKVFNVFKKIINQFISYLFTGKLRNIGATDPQPNPKAKSDRQFRNQAKLKQPGRETIEVPKLAPVHHIFNLSPLVRRSLEIFLFLNFLQ